ncbi:MAG: hypothetical protein ABR970_07990 [Roseiarcus sp.]|jgi:hypothetical protein
MLDVKSKLNSSVLFVLALLGAGLSTPAIDRAQAQTPSPFSGLEGKWSGDGSIALTNGTTERLRCDATYAVSGGGDNLDQTLRCASDSYKFDLRISLVDKAGAILGNWNELGKDVQGGISGRNSKGLIQVTVRGQNLNAAVTVATHGTEQSVEIRAQSGDLSQVKITLHHAR